MQITTRNRLVAMLLIGALVFSACAADDDASGDDADSTTTTTSAPSTTTTETPATTVASNEPDPDDRSPTSYIGLSLDVATARAEAQNRASRVIRLDGVPQDMEDDLQMSRLNFTVEDGVVTDAETDLQLVEAATGRSVSEFFVGMGMDDAMQVAADQGRAARIAVLDGEPLVLTEDFIEDRLNFTVDDGIVTDAKTDAEMVQN